MTVSIPERRRRGWRPAGLIALALGIVACRSPGALPIGSPLEPLPSLAAYLPDAADRAAREAAVASLLGSHAAVAPAIDTLTALEGERAREKQAPTGLLPVAFHLRDATFDDVFAYRRATRRLLERRDVDPALRARLEQELADDSLRLAEHRLRDARRARVARVFNALAEPLGRSLLTVTLAPYRLAQALLQVALAQHAEEAITLPERQALEHWKQYVEKHPDRAESVRLLAEIEALQERWYRMKRDRNVRAARQELERGRAERAVVMADRALRYAPEDAAASELRARAAEDIERRRAERRRSLGAPERPPPESQDLRGAELARAVLLADPGVGPAARALAAHADGPLGEAALLTAALVSGATGSEDELAAALRGLAGRDPAQSSVARHAEALLASPVQNPYAAFRSARRADRRRRTGWLLLGPLAGGARDRDLPRPVEWLVDAPAVVPALVSLPNRLVRAPWLRPTALAAAVHARTYLRRFPAGEHTAEVRDWLIGFEADRGNWIEAHRLALAGGATPERTEELRESAARQALAAARRQSRPDLRAGLLRHCAASYPGTPAGEESARLARQELEAATAQRIRISRGFLLENPEVASPAGLGLRPELLDGEPANGELHPQGVTLVGGRTLEFALLAPSGNPDASPRSLRREVSSQRLARLVALLDETALRNALVDPDADFAPDSGRDRYFERARLGVAEGVDARATARSTYAFLGLRERYGLVRRRESILPVDLVIQGSLPDLGLGAFPRLRPPKATPDAILYR